ncbi:hypothetical protein H310_08481 [Aphanomyces invadans]|uniref:Uncharacterized protein n=1 Tax=Aphanomyces invadans TaxID=157072 RepID=A0A024TYC3_9STRA|nr:hypothetical protein H310_08481 [Aphanomyces invadans]ETV99008.1 hypothetical protein H310_08481 [Aphanomyces invadans]|eukprot:XP_008872436.1 hypothetical protein H310_08481 [Aphanomyces invadans]
MSRFLVHVCVALAVLCGGAASVPDATAVTIVSAKTLNEHFKPAVPFQIESAKQLHATDDSKSQWRITSNKGAFDINVQEDASTKELSLVSVYQIGVDGTKTLIYEPKGLPTTWLLGSGLALLIVGVVVLTSSRPSSIARAPAAVPPSSPKGSAEATNASLRRRRSKLD